MAYSLIFWRDELKEQRPAEAVLPKLDSGEFLEGITWLSVDSIKRAFADAFPGVNDCGSYLDWEGSDSYFQVHWPACSKPQHTLGIFVEAGYQLLQSSTVLNRILTVAQGLGCALYDPQTGERYQQPV